MENNITKKHHALITGTGRAGTTFIMILLTKLGLDTGFSINHYHKSIHDNCNAGMEKILQIKNPPYIIKNPAFCDGLEKKILRRDIKIDHVFIPIRNVSEAAKSRVLIEKESDKSNYQEGVPIPGGLWGTDDPQKQELILHQKLSRLMLVLSKYFVPFTLIHYPKLTKQSRYLYRKLKPVLKDISFEQFDRVFGETVRPELVHSYSEM